MKDAVRVKISCSSCGAPVPATDVNLDRMVAKCRSCQSVFAVEGTDRTAGTAPSPPAKKKVALPPLPSGLEVHEVGASGAADPGSYRSAPAGGGHLVLSRRWLDIGHKAALVVGLVWMVGMTVWLIVGVAQRDVLSIVLPLTLMLAGSALLYFGALGALNSTRIEIAGGQLAVTYGPLPSLWVPSPRIPTQVIRSIDVRQKRRTSRESGSVYYVYRVVACMHDSREVELVRGLRDHEQARYIEGRIEQHLGLAEA